MSLWRAAFLGRAVRRDPAAAGVFVGICRRREIQFCMCLASACGTAVAVFIPIEAATADKFSFKFDILSNLDSISKAQYLGIWTRFQIPNN